MTTGPISFEDKMLLWLERVTDENKAKAEGHIRAANHVTSAAVATPHAGPPDQAAHLADATRDSEDHLRRAKTLLDGNGLLGQAVNAILKASNEQCKKIWGS